MKQVNSENQRVRSPPKKSGRAIFISETKNEKRKRRCDAGRRNRGDGSIFIAETDDF